MRLDILTGKVFDVLSASGVTGTPVAVTQAYAFIAVATDTKVFVYDYPAMTAVKSFDTNGGATLSPFPFVMTGGTTNPLLLVGSDPVAGCRTFVAKTGAQTSAPANMPVAVYRTTTGSQALTMSGGIANGAKHLYTTALLNGASSELAGFFGGNDVYNVLPFSGSVDRTGTYVGIPTRDSASGHQYLYFVRRSDGVVMNKADLGVDFSSTSGAAGVKFSPNSDAFVLYGKYPNTGSMAYYFTFDPGTLNVVAANPIIGTGFSGGDVGGHIAAQSIAHANVAGTPLTIELGASTDPNDSWAGMYVRSGLTGSTLSTWPYRGGVNAGRNALAVSPSGSRLAVAESNTVHLIDLNSNTELASYAYSSKGVAFIGEDDIYDGVHKLHYNGSGFDVAAASVALAGAVSSPSGGLVLGRDPANPKIVKVTDLNGTTSTRSFTAAAGPYGFIGEDKVWIVRTATSTTTLTTVGNVYNADLSPASGYVSINQPVTRTAGATEAAGGSFTTDGKWFVFWHTQNFTSASYSGNGVVVPAVGDMKIVSARTGATRETGLSLNVVDGGIYNVSVSDDGNNVEYSTNSGGMQSIFVPAWLESITVTPSSTIRGGKTLKATLTLTNPLRTTTTFPTTFSANLSSVSSFRVSAGSATSSINVNSNGVSASSNESISVDYKGETLAKAITLLPAAIYKVSFSANPVMAGASLTTTVQLDGKAPAGDLTVSLSASAPAAGDVPANIIIPAGLSTGSFTIDTHGVVTTTSDIITASANGTSKTGKLMVKAATIQSMLLDTNEVTGGEYVEATIAFTAETPAGQSLSFTSSNAAVDPMTVSVPAGVTSFTFLIPTNAVLSNANNFTLTSTYAGVARNSTLTVLAPQLDAFVVNHTSEVGGTTLTASIALTGIAAAGQPVTISSNNAAIDGISTTFTTGDNSMDLDIPTHTVAVETTVTLTLTIGGVTKQVTITLYPS